MNLQEMIELAILDAMGLLDEDERESFEASFRAATPSVQAQVRREQTRLSQIEGLLPDVSPPAGLRAVVLQVVRDEMARLKSPAAAAELVMPGIVPSRGVSPLWRAASLGLLAAVLVLGLTMFIFQTQQTRLLDQIKGDAINQALIEEFGTPFVMDVLFKPDTRQIHLLADDPSAFRGLATVIINPEWNEALFFCKDIITPAGRSYRLALIDEDGKVVEELADFTSSGGLKNQTVKLRYGFEGTLAILATGEGNRIISRARIQG